MPGGDGLDAARLIAEPRRAYLVVGAEPELDCADGRQALAAMKQADTVIVLSPFKSAAALEYADAMLPVSPFSETSGTFVSTEGRVQSFYAVTKPLGETRPAWKVLRVLGNLLELDGFDYESSEAVRERGTGWQTRVCPWPGQCADHYRRVSLPEAALDWNGSPTCRSTSPTHWCAVRRLCSRARMPRRRPPA